MKTSILIGDGVDAFMIAAKEDESHPRYRLALLVHDPAADRAPVIELDRQRFGPVAVDGQEFA
jgi:hypothetical protein